VDAGVRKFFATEIERLADRLFGSALRLTRNRDDAEDLVAETVAKAWAKCPELRDPQCFEAWIQRILVNTFMSAWRHRRASPEVTLECNDEHDEASEPFSLFEKLHQPFLLWWSNPEESVVTKLLREDIERVRRDRPDVLVGSVPDAGDEALVTLIAELDRAEANRDVTELRALEAAETEVFAPLPERQRKNLVELLRSLRDCV